MNCSIDLHSKNVPTGMYPVIVMDMWQHAYYKDYLKDAKTYLIAMMKQLNWNVIEERFKKAETPVAIGGYNTSVTYIPKNDFTEEELSMYNSWKDTGEFELDQKISAEKISKHKDILSRKFLENVDFLCHM